MTYKHIAIVAGLIMSTSLVAAPVTAAGLLGIGGNDGGGVVDVRSGSAGSDSLVNVGLGDGGSNSGSIADIKIGGGTGVNADANVSGGNGGLGADVDIDLGGLGIGADLDLGDGLDLDVDVDLGGNGPGGNGPGGVGPGVIGGGLGGGSRMANVGNALTMDCSLDEGRQVLQLAASSPVTRVEIAGWQRAANVRVVPVKLCPAARSQVSKILNQSPKINALKGAVAADYLISASLSRTRYDANDVFAVQRNGGGLTVYVF